MLKTYTFTGALYRSRIIRVNIKNRETLVEFGGGGVLLANPNCFFSTADSEMQEALENHPLFNVSDGFMLLRRDDSDDTTDPVVSKAVAEVKTLDEAKKYILKNYEGYTQVDVSTAGKVKELAVKLGISFPELVVSG
jgi:hypothetical protein